MVSSRQLAVFSVLILAMAALFKSVRFNAFPNIMNQNGLFSNLVRLTSSKQSSQKEVVTTDWASPVAAYSAATKANGFIFVSGQLGIDATTKKFVSDSVTDQALQALRNIQGIVTDAGSDLNKVTKTTVLLADIEDFAAVNQVYLNFFKENQVNELPARAAYAVAALPLNGKVEIEAIAIE